MGLRAYLLVEVADDVEQQQFIAALRKLEDTPGVDFVDPVIGSHDIVIMVEAPVTVEALANKIRIENKWIKKVHPRTTADLLRTMLNYILHYGLTDSDFVKHRTDGLENVVKEVEEYPLEKCADKLWVKPANIVELIHLYIRARNPVIVVNADTISPADLELLCNLALVTGNVGREGAGIIALRSYGNSQGQIDMGVSPFYLPGHGLINNGFTRQKITALWGKELPGQTGKGTVEIISGGNKGNIRGLLIVSGGKDLCLDSAYLAGKFSVAITPLLEEGLAQADVILPGTTFAETEGTFTSSERTVQRLHQAIKPVAGRQTWQILCELAEATGYIMDYKSVSEIFAEITAAARIYSGINYADIPEGGIQWSAGGAGSGSLYLERFDFQDGLARFNIREREPDIPREICLSLSR